MAKMSNFELLEMQLNHASEEGEIMCLIIKNENLPLAELIIVHTENLTDKIEYIRKAYTKDLRLKTNWDILIDGFYRMNDPQLKALMEGKVI